MKSFFKKENKNNSLNNEPKKEIKNIEQPKKVEPKVEPKKEFNNFKPRKDKIMKETDITTLTQDVEIKGTIKFNKILEINGKFEGELITPDGEVIVGSTGELKANFKAKNAVIEGKVDGNVTATEKIELKNNAQLIGDLTAKTLSIEEGVLFVGQCNVNPSGVKQEKITNNENKK